MSIRLRLTLWHTALLALMLAGFAVALYVIVSRQLSIELDREIQLRAQSASRALRTVSPSLADQYVGPPPRGPRDGGPPDAHRNGDPPGEPGGRRGGEPGGNGPPGPPPFDRELYIQVLDPSGAVLDRSPNLEQPLPIPPESLRQVLDGREVHDTVEYGQGRVALFSAPLLRDGVVVGVLQVAAPLDSLESSLTQLRIALGLVVLVAVGIAAALGWFLAGQALRPVDRMTRTAAAIGHSADLTRRIRVTNSRDELGRLAATFNEMLAQLDRAFAYQRRFLADAAHELRTPLTTVRLNVEALLRGADAEPHERDETLRALLRESERMGRLVADLLALARADAGQPLERRPVALDELLLDVFRQAKPMADGVRLELGELEPVEVPGDRDRLKQLMLNLVDNALRYTPPGGTVTLDLVRGEQYAELRVRDTGIGIAAEHLPRIFERFYRVDRGRSRSQGGTGLGLAISRWIAEAHHGSIEVESQEGQGSTFTLRLPTHVAASLSSPPPPSHPREALLTKS